MIPERAQLRDYRLSSLDRRGDQRRSAVCFLGTGWASSVVSSDSASQHGSPLWASPDLPATGRKPHRTETRHIAPLAAIRRIVTAVRLWRGRTRSRQDLRELSEPLLKDIGLRREEVGYEFPQLFRHCD